MESSIVDDGFCSRYNRSCHAMAELRMAGSCRLPFSSCISSSSSASCDDIILESTTFISSSWSRSASSWLLCSFLGTTTSMEAGVVEEVISPGGQGDALSASGSFAF